MNLKVSEKWHPFIRAEVQSGRYSTEDEVVEAALRLLEQRDQKGPERAERIEAIQASIEDMRAGRVTPAEDMLAEMRQTLAEAQRR